MTSLLARFVRPGITLEMLIVFGDSLPQCATAVEDASGRQAVTATTIHSAPAFRDL